MITINNKQDCCGCSACNQICPTKCIQMQADNEGFLYPAINVSDCINCGLCEKVCPVINQGDENTPKECIAAWNNNNEIFNNSSSGGIFSMLAEKVIENGGVVFGAVFDTNMAVCHTVGTAIEDISFMRGSKYLQSRLDNSLSEVKNYLLNGKLVLFSGTQCQVAGLNRFLRKPYENLLTVEVVCHGVSSPETWLSYIPHGTNTVNFRDKRIGWRPSGISINDKLMSHTDCSYLQSFFCKINMRPSCYACPAKKGKSGADITIGDFWGIENFVSTSYNKMGTSLIVPRTNKGRNFLDGMNFNKLVLPYNNALHGNPSLEASVDKPINRSFFFWSFKKYGFEKAWIRTISTKPIDRLRRRIFRTIHMD